MSKNDEYKQFLPDEELKRKRIVYEVPANAESPYQEIIPNGYDPIGQIYLDGKAYRSFAGGRISWWVLITGWVVFGSISFAVLSVAILLITSEFLLGLLTLLPTLLIAPFFIIILWRGTVTKLSIKKNRGRRRM